MGQILMGPNGASSGARGKVLANNWSLHTEASSASRLLARRARGVSVGAGGVSVGVGLRDDAWPGVRLSMVLLTVGSCVLLLPIVLHAVAYHAPTLRTALETMMTMLGLTAAWLLRGQFASSRRLSDLLLFGTALTMGLMALCVGALPAALDLRQSTHFAAAELWSQLFVGVMFAAVAFAPSDRLVVGARYPVLSAAALSVAGVGGAALGGLLLHVQLVGGRSHDTEAAVQVLGHPLGLVVVLTATVLFAFAATGFARRHRPGRNGVSGLLAAAALMLAAGSFYHLVPGALPPGQIGPGQALVVAAFALLLIVAVRKDFQARARMTNAAAMAERRRVARDLHDGLAQDLALIAVHGELIAQDIGGEHPMVLAARHALALSRSTIAELSDPPGATPDEALEAVAQEFRDRFDVAIAVEADCDREFAPEAQAHVSRIAREAIANAARHGGAKHVVVSLRGDDSGVTLRVVDDGCGIVSGDVAAATEGFGLRSVRERTDALGGCLTLRRLRKGGTELEVILP
jgi:signal transduction histidine kinase